MLAVGWWVEANFFLATLSVCNQAHQILIKISRPTPRLTGSLCFSVAASRIPSLIATETHG